MKQKSYLINLRDFTEDDHAFGNRQGRETYRKLLDVVDEQFSYIIFEISLEDMEATDASFPRESVVSLAKQYRGEKGFLLSGFKSRDLVDNWNYAAKAKEQPLIIWDGDEHEWIGPEINSSTKVLLDFIIREGTTTTSKVSETFEISVQNASSKLKKLYNQGFILGSKEIAQSGGIEFIYKAIK